MLHANAAREVPGDFRAHVLVVAGFEQRDRERLVIPGQAQGHASTVLPAVLDGLGFEQPVAHQPRAERTLRADDSISAAGTLRVSVRGHGRALDELLPLPDAPGGQGRDIGLAAQGRELSQNCWTLTVKGSRGCRNSVPGRRRDWGTATDLLLAGFGRGDDREFGQALRFGVALGLALGELHDTLALGKIGPELAQQQQHQSGMDEEQPGAVRAGSPSRTV